MEDGGSGEGHDEDPAEDAAQRYHLSWNGPRHHVAVADGRHGDDRPPVGGRDAAEVMGAGELTLSQVDQRREEGDGHAEEEQKEAELPGAASDRQPERLQAERVASQPHHVENPQRPQDPQYQAQLVQVALTASWSLVLQGWVFLLHHQGDIVRKDCHGVDDVQWPTEEVQLAAGLDEPQDELQGEPGHTHCLYDEHVVALGRALTLRERGKRKGGVRQKARQMEKKACEAGRQKS